MSVKKENNSNPTTIYTGVLNWEGVSNESKRLSQIQVIPPVKEDIDCCGLRRQIATVYVSRPNPTSDTVCLRFYVCSEKRDSMRVSD